MLSKLNFFSNHTVIQPQPPNQSAFLREDVSCVSYANTNATSAPSPSAAPLALNALAPAVLWTAGRDKVAFGARAADVGATMTASDVMVFFSDVMMVVLA